MRRRTFKSAFTLVELLVVIGIIALLISILLPALSKAQSVARQASCASNMHQLGLLVIVYATDNKGSLPPIVVACKDNGSGAPDNVHYYVDGSNPPELWSILETYEALTPMSKMCVCPEVYGNKGTPNPTPHGTYKGLTADYPNAVFSYLYSEIIGGLQQPNPAFGGYAPTTAGPVEVNVSGTNYWFARPCKQGEIHNSSTTAMFVETNSVYQKPWYYWAHNLNQYCDLNWVTDVTKNGHQQFYGVGIVHSPKYMNGYNPDGTHCGIAQGNVLCCDGSVQNHLYHQGTADTNGGPKNGLGFIDGIGADPGYSP